MEAVSSFPVPGFNGGEKGKKWNMQYTPKP